MSQHSPQHIMIISGTRADWGLLSPIALSLQATRGVCLSVVATNMHLLDQYGHTVDEVKADGIREIIEVPIFENGSGCDATENDSEKAKVKAMGKLMEGLADVFSIHEPDKVIILGDRYEMLAAASAATVMKIPVIHIAGGEISEGAVDDAIRHAITKCASLHLTATEEYRQRVIQMGERPETVINTGAIGLWNISRISPMARGELESSIGWRFTHPSALMTFHPATLDSGDASGQCRAIFAALMKVPGLEVLVTYPNNDARSQPIIYEIEKWVEEYPHRIKAVKSLGMKRYLSVLRYVDFVIGNSSSGLVEVPGAGIPTINVGIRQRGRTAGPSVIQCDGSPQDLDRAIERALTTPRDINAGMNNNPYYKPDTLEIMLDAIISTPRDSLLPKKFHDIKK